MAVILTLGPLLFTDFEIPETINFGGEQMLVVKKLVGGDRIVDAMGRDDADIGWSGRFRGDFAEARAAQADLLRSQGQEQVLAWSNRRYRVIIRSFKADFNQSYEIPYSITCTVLEDLSNPILIAGPSIDSAVTSDIGAAVELGGPVPSVNTAVANVQTSLGGITSFQTATGSQISGVQTALAASLTIIDGEVGTRNGVIAASTGVGGMTAGLSPQLAASGLLAQSNAMTELTQLIQVRALLGRTQVNVTNAGA